MWLSVVQTKEVIMTRIFFTICLVLLFAGCANTIQTASITEAYKEYEAQDYDAVLELISRAENVKETTPEMKAELTWLKAQSHEKSGRREYARTLYEYLRDQHSDSQYGYLASKRLQAVL